MTLTLGQSRGGNTIRLTDEERSRHIHILGASGSGKSKLLENLLRQDIAAGRGLCLIDPHGTLADDILRWCAATGMERFRKIHIIEPANLDWSVGFNPLRLDGFTEPAVRVEAMVSACAQVWGGEDTYATPLLRKCLQSVFHTLCVRGLTLAEALLLTTNADVQLRRTLTEGLPDSVFDTVWRDFEGLPRREYVEQFSSTNNRLIEFLASPIVRRIVGQRERALDLRQVMDNGEILIVNLKSGGQMSPSSARLIGTLLTSELFLLALTRDQATAKRRPFSLYIDECSDYLTSDIEGMLDQTRKFGLHLILSHQRLTQLRHRSESIFSGVMAGGQTKVVFGGMADEDAELMAREIMRTSVNLERPKHVLDKPVVVDEAPFWLESESWGQSEVDTATEGQSFSRGSVRGGSQSVSMTFDRLGRQIAGYGEVNGGSWSMGEGEANASSRSHAAGSSYAHGRSQTLRPVRQWLPTAVHSLEEEMHLAILRLRELPKADAIVKRQGNLPVRISTPIIRPGFAKPERIRLFSEATRQASAYLTQRSTAEAEVETRRVRLNGRVQAPTTDSFWSAEGK